jgi:cobalt-zinc-cadmium efflux system outer membrane protein
VVLNFSMPLAFGNRNSGAIREATIRRDQVEVDRQAALESTQAELFEFHQSLQQARAEVTALRSQLIPQAEAALQQMQYGYERGRFSYLELADAQRELLLMRREAIAAAATYHRLLAEIERLTRTPLAAEDRSS